MNPPQNRDLNSLHQAFRTPFERWLADVRAAGFTLLVYECRRTRARQAFLYAQGRTRPGPVVTYTLNSAHLYGLAADMVLTVNGQPDWSEAAYNRLHQAVPPGRYGLELLNFEKPHLQVKGGQDAAPGLGLTPDSRISSVWPLPTSAVKPSPAPVPVVPDLGRVVMVDLAGQDIALLDRRAVYGGVLVERVQGGVRLSRR